MGLRGISLFLVGLALTAQLGCAQMSLLSFGHSNYETDAAGKLELSGREAARARLATAKEMEKGGKIREAVIFYEAARAKDPSLQHLSRRLAVLYEKLGQFEHANAEYQKALQREPGDADLLNDIGYGYYCRGQWREAEENLRAALKHKSDHKRARINLGMTLGQQERYAESLQEFKKVLQPAYAYCNLAFIFTTQGKMDQAAATYRQALNQQPSLRLAQAALAKLEGTDAPDDPSESKEVANDKRTIQKHLPESDRELFERRRAETERLLRQIEQPVVVPDPFNQPTSDAGRQ